MKCSLLLYIVVDSNLDELFLELGLWPLEPLLSAFTACVGGADVATSVDILTILHKDYGVPLKLTVSNYLCLSLLYHSGIFYIPLLM